MEFFSELARARMLLEQGNIDACLNVLITLGADYRRGAQFVDLLGDAFLVKGDIHAGIRYKTLFEILTRVLDSVDKRAASLNETRERDRSSAASASFMPQFQSLRIPSEPDDEGAPEAHEPGFDSSSFMPVTLAMGKQFLAQGHFDLAIGVFERLRQRDPLDHEVNDLLNQAKASKKRKTALHVLQKWLKNVESLKAQREALP
ncbi:MAG: hypothetical protein ACP5M0_11185 [Desulfomonilaceae bacterium]